MVVGENNNFLHARIHPTMVLIKVAVGGNQVELSGPNMESISIPLPTKSGNKLQVRKVRYSNSTLRMLHCMSSSLSQEIFCLVP